MEIPGRLVVRTYAPARRGVMLAMLVLLCGLALYVAFELGRYKAGYDAMQAAAEREALQVQIGQLQQSERETRVQLAAAEEGRDLVLVAWKPEDLESERVAAAVERMDPVQEAVLVRGNDVIRRYYYRIARGYRGDRGGASMIPR